MTWFGGVIIGNQAAVPADQAFRSQASDICKLALVADTTASRHSNRLECLVPISFTKTRLVNLVEGRLKPNTPWRMLPAIISRQCVYLLGLAFIQLGTWKHNAP